MSSLFPFEFDLIAAEGSEATLDEDLLGLPSSAAIPVGEYSLSLTFEVPQDFEDEGTEHCISRSSVAPLRARLRYHFDTPEFVVEMPEEYVVPCDETAEVCVDLIQEGYEYPPVEFDWYQWCSNRGGQLSHMVL